MSQGGPPSITVVPGFPQQGQVDWVTFGNTTLSASLNVLRRLSAAGVQPVTHCGGLYLGNYFIIGKQGESRVDEAIGDLRSASGIDNVLYFGFGYTSYVRVLAETRPGTNFIALCSCISEVHSENVAARILAALWKELRFPSEYEPAYSQFVALVRACAGVITTTTFAQTVEIMKGDLRRLSTGDGNFGTTVSEPKEIAKALRALFDISKGVMEEMTVVGGAEAAFVAALAFWLFNFPTEVEDPQGNLVFTSAPDHESAQVKISYCLPQDSRTFSTHSTFVLGDLNELVASVPDSRMRNLVSRIPWDRCLSRTFGTKFELLQASPNILGGFLGSAARIYSAVANGEDVHIDVSRAMFINFVEASYGYGFVDSVQRIFPEMKQSKGLHEAMVRAVESPLGSALCKIEETLESLAKLCGCGTCRRLNTETSSRLCLPSIAITVLHLVVVLSSVVLRADVEPSATGLEEIYTQKNTLWKRNQVQGASSFRAYHCIGITCNNAGRADICAQTPGGMLGEVECVFTGYRSAFTEMERTNYRTAFSRSGLCFYLEALSSVTCDAASLRRIYVIPGHISWHDRIYTSVWDCAPGRPPPSLDEITFEESVAQTPELRQKPEAIRFKTLVSEISADEGEAIALYYKVSLKGGDVLLRPGYTTQSILRYSGLLSCKRNESFGGCGHELAMKCIIISKGWGLQRTCDSLEYPCDIACCIWTYQDDIARWVIIEIESTRSSVGEERQPKRMMFVRQKECISCSTACVLLATGRATADEGQIRILAHLL